MTFFVAFLLSLAIYVPFGHGVVDVDGLG